MGTVTLNTDLGIAGLGSVSSASASCADVIAAMQAINPYTSTAPGSCSSDPLVVGSTVTWTNGGGVQTVAALTGFDSGTGTGTGGTTTAPAYPAIFDLTPEQGSLLGAAILGVWAIAWVFRAVARALDSDEANPG